MGDGKLRMLFTLQKTAKLQLIIFSDKTTLRELLFFKTFPVYCEGCVSVYILTQQAESNSSSSS